MTTTEITAEWGSTVELADIAATHETGSSTTTLRLTARSLVVAGLVIVGAGFGLIGVTWARISPLKIVAQQLPYLVSAGFTGVALVVLGSALLITASKRADDALRRVQTVELVTALRDLRTALDLDATTPPAKTTRKR